MYNEFVMNKHFIIAIFTIFIIVGIGFGVLLIVNGYFLLNKIDLFNTNLDIKTDNVEKKSSFDIYKKIIYKDLTYSYDYFSFDDNHDLMLIANFDKQFDSKIIKESGNCDYLTSAGFYTKDNRPLGLFFSEDRLLRNYSKNNLIDGVLYKVRNDDLIHIEFAKEVDDLVWGIQVGPMLIWNQEKLFLDIASDKYSRRVVYANDVSGKSYFFVIFGDKSLYEGPFLSDLPDLLSVISNDLNLELETAVNLDGGSASAYFGEKYIFEERTFIGSAFCVKRK